MRREERVTVQGPVKEQQSDGMSHRGCKTPYPPPTNPPTPFKLRKSSVLCFVKVHTYCGPRFIVGDQIYCLPPSPCSRLFPPSVKQCIGGLRVHHFQKLFFFFFIFLFLSVK